MVITLDRLAEGISRCEKAHPIIGFVLSPELSRLSAVLGIMAVYKLDILDTYEFSRYGLNQATIEEVSKWVESK
jgi:hypothetical protein